MRIGNQQKLNEVLTAYAKLNHNENVNDTILDNKLKNGKLVFNYLDTVLNSVLKLEMDNRTMKTEMEMLLENATNHNRATNEVEDKMVKLNDEKKQLETKLNEMTNFLQKYELSPQDLHVLQFKDIKNEQELFFDTLRKAALVKVDCQKYVAMEQEDDIGMDLLDNVSKQYEAALYRVFTWTLAQCRAMEDTEYSFSTQLFQHAMNAIVERESYIGECKEAYVKGRQSIVLRSYLNYLNRKDKQSSMNVYDRSVVQEIEMLNWLEKSVLEEMDVVKSVFQNDKTIDVVGGIYAALENPLLIRFNQINMEELKLVEHFMLLCRIQQNADQIGGMMPGFPLHLAFEQMVQVANNAFEKNVVQYTEKLSKAAQGYFAEVAVTHTTMEQELLMTEIIETSHQYPGENAQFIAKTVLNSILQAMTDFVDTASKEMNEIDRVLFTINNTYSIQANLNRLQFESSANQNLQHLLTNNVNFLAEKSMQTLLSDSKVCKLLPFMANPPVAFHELHIDPSEVTSIMNEFAISVANLDSRQSDRLTSFTTREMLKNGTVEKCIQIYTDLHQFLLDPENKVPNATKTAGKTPQEVERLIANA